ncbi:hypothetical protein [Olleya sp. Bg11-27]|uniref:hypothetical protein n=1 Tax=Olleya sp. Bg11-27 TaxID=2058135 RepID=UPI000C30D8FD|nr:hypothetical protein [Olleya sp. Bg11-27]AUC75659.1 hypothetical protein CW732_08225 [Olleya sp. Bg11-27]
MKLTLIFILFFSFLSCQTSEKEFIVTDYDFDGKEYENTIQKIDIDFINIDFKLMRAHFNVPYYFPEKFIDSKYKNQTITTWRNEDEKADEFLENFKNNNWTHTYKYDYESKIVEYSYSGCMICSNMPYNYKVTYDENKRVIKLKNTTSEKQKFEFKYNSNGDIIELKLYSSKNKLKKQITLK